MKRTADNRLAYRDSGSTTAGTPGILLVHGWGVSGALFDGQLSALSEHFRVIVPDLPGHGASAGFPEDGKFTLLADSLAGLLAEIDLESVCLVGWSLGALVVWDLLQRYPGQSVRGVVTVDMVPRLLNDESWHFGLRAGSDHHVFDRHIQWMLDDWPSYTELFVSRIFAADAEVPAGLRQHAIAAARANDPRIMAAIWKTTVEQDFRTALASVQVPALVVAGGRSQLYGKPAADWIVRQMPHATLAVFVASGHAPQLEEPLKFNRLLAEFARSPIDK